MAKTIARVGSETIFIIMRISFLDETGLSLISRRFHQTRFGLGASIFLTLPYTLDRLVEAERHAPEISQRGGRC
jgi:hypothetical protein